MVINGATSEPVSVISGVPQGSVLGPLLFIIYVNALCELNLSSSCKLAMYADDLVLYKPITSECEWFAFQQDITAISEWVDEHLLSLNISKCECMLLTRKSSRMPVLFLSNKVIEQVSSYKYPWCSCHFGLEMELSY